MDFFFLTHFMFFYDLLKKMRLGLQLVKKEMCVF